MDGNLRLGGQGTRVVAWSMVLLLAIFVFFLHKNPPISNTFAVVEPVDAHRSSGYVYLAGQWFDLNGHPLASHHNEQFVPKMLAPLHNGELLLSTSDRQLWRCGQNRADCQPWAGDIEPRNQFELVEMDDGNIVLMTHTPTHLYLLDQNGKQLDRRFLHGSHASLSRLESRVFLISRSRKEVRAINVEDNAFGTLETVLDLSEQSLISGHDYPHRLRRVDDHWWLSLLDRGDHPGFAVLDDHWNLIGTHAPQVDGRITDWFVDKRGQLLLASNQHKLFRHDLSRRQSALLFQAEADLLVKVYDNLTIIFVLFLVAMSIGIFALFVRARACMEPATESIRNSLHSSMAKFDAEAIESMRHAELVWLSPGKRLSRTLRWQALGWKLAPAWSGALLVVSLAFASGMYERSESLPAATVFVVAMILIIIQSLVHIKEEHKNSQLELGVEGKEVLLRDPAGRVQRFASGDLLFDGDRLLIDRVTKKIFGRRLSMASPTLQNRHFLYEPTDSEISLQPILEEVPVVTPLRMNWEISRRSNHRWLDRAVIVAIIALPFTSFL